MFPELSLNILDVAQNSIKAHATFIQISVHIDTKQNELTILIEDNGIGMDTETTKKALDPFYTTRTTRSIGLGIPLFRQAALMTGGTFQIISSPGKGTKLLALFHTDHIDCMPLGDISSTIYSLIITNESLDFLYTYSINNKSFTLDTREFRQILNDLPFSTAYVSSFIKDYLIENKHDVDC